MESYIYGKQEPIREDIFQCLGNRPSVLRAREIGERILGRMRGVRRGFCGEYGGLNFLS